MRRALLVAGWVGALLLVAALAIGRLQVSGDLRMFLPAAQTDQQRLLLDLVGRGPAARTLLIALSGAPAERLAEASIELRDALAERPEFELVANGDDRAEAIDQALLPYRYLLSPTLDRQPFDAALLRDELQARLQDLGSPAAALVEPWIPRDPTLELLQLAERWRPPVEPDRVDGVWVGPDRREALLLLQTADGGFDPQAQQAAIDAIDAALAGLADPALRLEVSGPGAFAVLLQRQTRAQATQLGLLASLGIVLLLALAYRSLRAPLLAALPVASGALVALATVALLFPQVHGITLAFGFTLLGLAQDYPVHLLSHLRPRREADDAGAAWPVVRAIGPTLATGVVSTCVAYLSFVVVGIDGLLQLASFAIVGLLTAAATTRWLLPALLSPPVADVAERRWVRRLGAVFARWPRGWPALLPAALLAVAGLVGSSQPLWNDDLGSLTPVPPELLRREGELRAALGAADVRHLLVIEAGELEQVLQASERLEPALQALVEAGALAGYELPSTYLPSLQTQRSRQARLPDPARARQLLIEATAGLPFRHGLFEPFIADLAAARTLPPLAPDGLADTPLSSRLQGLLRETADGRRIGLVSLIGLRDRAALEAMADSDRHWHLLDLKAASESLSSSYRQRLLGALALATLLLLLALRLSLGSWSRLGRVVVPMLLATLLTAALLHALDGGFTLFHLVSLVLAAGLGLDYALFFEHAGRDQAAQRRALHSILVCAGSTVLVFGLLGSSDIPVLRAIGLTVAVGAVLQFLLAAMLANRGERDDRA